MRLNTLSILLVAAFGAIGVASPASAAGFAHLTLQSQTGDYIGQGKNFDITYTPANSPSFFSAQATSGNPPRYLRFLFDNSAFSGFNTFTTIDFGTNQLGIPIQTGTYLNAERAAFASAGHAGLDVSFQNRGSNTLTGQFTINTLTYTAGSSAANGWTIQDFDVNFEQHSEGAVPALFGSLTYSSVPFEFNPALGLGILGGLFGVRKILKKLSQRSQS